MAAAILIVLSGASALACYSGLVVIPTADIVGSGEYCMELQYDGVLAPNSADARVLNTQFGIAPGLEVGFDLDLSEDSETRVLGNAKCLLLPADGRKHAVAVGICNISHGRRNSPYALVTHHCHPLRGHFGIMCIDGANCCFAGADHAINDRLILMADHTSGNGNCSSVGLSYQKTDRFGIMAGVLLPNNSKENTGFSVHLVFSGT
jgi:hypothetical protein